MSGADRQFFRVPCEYQLRLKLVDDTEFNFFKAYALRPSPTSSARTQIENHVGAIDVKDSMKGIIELAIGVLLNIDQRLERVEENVLSLLLDRKEDYVPYEWVTGDIGAGGIGFTWDKNVKFKSGDRVLVDLLLPDMPEYRIVAASEVTEVKEENLYSAEFVAIHHDDRESLHRFVMARQRELLRERANRKKESE